MLQYGTSAADDARALAVHAGEIYVGGEVGGALPSQQWRGDRDVYVRKYAADRTEAWTRQFGTSGYDSLGAVVSHPTGVYVAGLVSGALPASVHAGRIDSFVRKYDENGAVVWTRQFGTPDDDGCCRMVADATALYVAGQTCGDLPTQSDDPGCYPFVRKYTLDGTDLWTRQFGENGSAVGVAVYGNSLYVSGAVFGALPGQTHLGQNDAYLRKYDVDGNEVWTRQFGTPRHEFGEGVAADPTGVYVVTSGGFREVDSGVWKFNHEGTSMWVRSLGTDVAPFPTAVDPSGVYVAGISGLDSPSSSRNWNGFFRKYDSDGVVQWTLVLDQGRDDRLSAIVIGASGVYVAGATDGVFEGQSSAGSYDAFVAKLAPIQQAQVCPASQGYWKNHVDSWPSASLVLGNETYSVSELVGLLRTPSRGDASLILSHQLVAAKLNIAAGSDPEPIEDALADTDTVLASFASRLPLGIRPSSDAGRQMVELSKVLDEYNNRGLTPECEELSDANVKPGATSGKETEDGSAGGSRSPVSAVSGILGAPFALAAARGYTRRRKVLPV